MGFPQTASGVGGNLHTQYGTATVENAAQACFVVGIPGVEFSVPRVTPDGFLSTNLVFDLVDVQEPVLALQFIFGTGPQVLRPVSWDSFISGTASWETAQQAIPVGFDAFSPGWSIFSPPGFLSTNLVFDLVDTQAAEIALHFTFGEGPRVLRPVPWDSQAFGISYVQSPQQAIVPGFESHRFGWLLVTPPGYLSSNLAFEFIDTQEAVLAIQFRFGDGASLIAPSGVPPVEFGLTEVENAADALYPVGIPPVEIGHPLVSDQSILVLDFDNARPPLHIPIQFYFGNPLDRQLRPLGWDSSELSPWTLVWIKPWFNVYPVGLNATQFGTVFSSRFIIYPNGWDSFQAGNNIPWREGEIQHIGHYSIGFGTPQLDIDNTIRPVGLDATRWGLIHYEYIPLVTQIIAPEGFECLAFEDEDNPNETWVSNWWREVRLPDATPSVQIGDPFVAFFLRYLNVFQGINSLQAGAFQVGFHQDVNMVGRDHSVFGEHEVKIRRVYMQGLDSAAFGLPTGNTRIDTGITEVYFTGYNGRRFYSERTIPRPTPYHPFSAVYTSTDLVEWQMIDPGPVSLGWLLRNSGAQVFFNAGEKEYAITLGYISKGAGGGGEGYNTWTLTDLTTSPPTVEYGGPWTNPFIGYPINGNDIIGLHAFKGHVYVVNNDKQVASKDIAAPFATSSVGWTERTPWNIPSAFSRYEKIHFFNFTPAGSTTEYAYCIATHGLFRSSDFINWVVCPGANLFDGGVFGEYEFFAAMYWIPGPLFIAGRGEIIIQVLTRVVGGANTYVWLRSTDGLNFDEILKHGLDIPLSPLFFLNGRYHYLIGNALYRQRIPDVWTKDNDERVLSLDGVQLLGIDIWGDTFPSFAAGLFATDGERLLGAYQRTRWEDWSYAIKAPPQLFVYDPAIREMEKGLEVSHGLGILSPRGFRPREFGEIRVWNRTQFITFRPLCPEPGQRCGTDWGQLHFFRVFNRNRTVTPHGTVMTRFAFRAALVTNTGRAVLVKSFDPANFAPWYERHLVSHYIRYLPMPGLDSLRIVTHHRIQNAARALYLVGFVATQFGNLDKILWRWLLQNGRRHDEFGMPWVSRSPRFISTISTRDFLRFSHPFVAFGSRYLEPESIEPSYIPRPYLTQKPIPTLTPYWTRNEKQFGAHAVKNNTPQLFVVGRLMFSSTPQFNWISHSPRYPAPQGWQTTRYGRPDTLFRDRVLPMVGVASSRVTQHFRVENKDPTPVLPSQQTVYMRDVCRGRENTRCALVGEPEVRSNVLFLEGNSFLWFGEPSTQSNGIIFRSTDHPFIYGWTEWGIPRTNRPRVIDLGMSKGWMGSPGQSFGIKPNVPPKFRVSPHTIWARLDTPQQAIENHRPNEPFCEVDAFCAEATHPFGESADHTGPWFGAISVRPDPGVEKRNDILCISTANPNSEAFKSCHRMFMRVGEPVIETKNRRITFEGQRIGRYGYPYLSTPELTEARVWGSANTGAECGEPIVENKNRGITVPSVPPVQFGATLIELYHRPVYPTGVDTALWGDNTPMVHFPRRLTPIDTDMTQYGIAWISHSPRTVFMDGHDSFDTDWTVFREWTAVLHMRGVVRGYGYNDLTLWGDAYVSQASPIISPYGIAAPCVNPHINVEHS